ncbi:MAG: OsmC family protein [Rhodospirillaceae bacterium]|jgi:uncharacterized OsmC-like protein|nr:OsmC family protein [Rhodospirillaceae bacterium]
MAMAFECLGGLVDDAGRSTYIQEKKMAVVKLKDPEGAKVRTISSVSGNGIRCDIAAEDHAFATDEPEERGGTGTAASPLMYFTASLAACQTVQIHKVAKAMRFNHGAININCATTTDRIPGIGSNDKVMRFCAAELQVDIETDEPEDKVQRLMDLAEDQCPVGNLFTDAGYPPVLTFNILPMPA